MRFNKWWENFEITDISKNDFFQQQKKTKLPKDNAQIELLKIQICMSSSDHVIYIRKRMKILFENKSELGSGLL